MPGIQKSLRLPPETMSEIERLAKETGQDFSNITKDLLEEALKMRRCPGILFAEGTSGRRARVAGTGIEVWRSLPHSKAWKRMSKDFARHITGFPTNRSKPRSGIIRPTPRKLIA